jgi:HD superfamily phosphodiesterase
MEQTIKSARNLPNDEDVTLLLEAALTPYPIVLHQRVVAGVALKIGHVYASRKHIDLPLLEAAAKLHDIKKTEPSHAKRGAEFLKKNGYPEVAEVIRGHTNIRLKNAGAETKLLYLADKYVSGLNVMPLLERVSRIKEKLASGKPNKSLLSSTLHRMEIAMKIEKSVEKVAGLPSLSRYILS